MADAIRVGSGSIILVPDARQFRSKSNTELSKIELIHRVHLTPQLATGYRRDAQGRLDTVRLTHNVILTPRLGAGFRSDARGRIDSALRGIDHSVTLNVQLSTALATAQMARWRREQEALPLRIRVVTDRSGAGSGGGVAAADAARLEHLGRSFSSRNSGLMLPVSIDGGSMASATRQLENFAKDEFGESGRGPRKDRGRYRIRPEIPDLKNDPAIRNALRKQSYALNDAFRLRIQPNLAGLQLRLPLGGLGIAAIPEMVSQLGGLAAAITQAGQAALILPGAFGSIGAVLATAVIGVHGLKDAWTALDGQQKAGAQSAGQTRDLQREVTNSVNDEMRARRSLSDALQSEQRRQRDLKLELRGSKLSEAEAILAVQDAEATIREGHFANVREYDHALLQYEESKQNLLQVRNKNADLTQDVAKNEATGVAGSDAVLNASQALQSATERVADATEKLAAGGTAMETATGKVKEAMDKLAPSGREFIQTLFDMRPALRQFANDIQQPLLVGTGEAFKNMFNSPAIQTNLKTGMAGLAVQMNGIINDTLGRLGSQRSGDLISRLFGNTTDATQRFRTQVLGPLTDGLGTLVAAGSDSIPRVASALGDVAGRFDNFITKADKDGSLKHWIDQGLDAFTQAGRIVSNLMSSLEGISRAFGGSFLINIDNLTAKLSRFLNSAQGQQDLTNFISQTKIAFQQWEPILKEIPDMLKVAFDTGRTVIAGFLPAIQLVVDIFRTCPGLIQGVATAFVAWKTIGPIVTALQGAMNITAQAVTNVGTRFGPMKAEGARAASEVDKAFKGTAGEGGALHGTARSVSNLAGMLQLGGPLAAAITTGAMVVLDMWISKQQEAAQVTENLRQQQERLADTLDRVTGLVTQQTRESLGKSFSDFKPQDKSGLGGDVLGAAAAIGVGGAGGTDLVTAALPGGTKQYADIMGQLREKLRPSVKGYIDELPPPAQQALKTQGISEEDVLNAFLGDPAALQKFRGANLKDGTDLGALARRVQSEGGSRMQAALVGQALNEQKFGVQGAGTLAGRAATAARQPVSLSPAASIFGTKSTPSAAGGEFKITSDVDPASPAMQQLLANPNSGITANENPPGTTPYKSWTYTLSREQAQKYFVGVPAYSAGGPTKAGLAVLHEPEYVVSEKGVNAYGQRNLDNINEGKPMEDLPHFDIGGPFGNLPLAPPKPPEPPIPAPKIADVTPSAPSFGGTGPGAPKIADLVPQAPIPAGAGQGAPLPSIDPSQIPAGGGINPIGGIPNFGAPGGGINPQNILQQFLGGGSGGGGAGSAPDLGGIAARFGSILMQGVLGFFGINPQYINDIDKVLNFGLSKFGSGGIDPSAQANISANIAGYEADGTPIYNLPVGQSGTPLPGVGGGTGGAAGGASIKDFLGTPSRFPGTESGGLQPNAQKSLRAISAAFPQIGDIGGVRQDALKWHPEGLALDVMIPGQGGLNDKTTPEGLALGNQIWSWLDQHQHELGVDMGASLWQQKDHYNHIHVAVYGKDNPAPAGFETAADAGGSASGIGAQLGGGYKPWWQNWAPKAGGGGGGGGLQFPPLDMPGRGGAGGLPGRPGGAGQSLLWSPKHGVIGVSSTDLFGGGGGSSADNPQADTGAPGGGLKAMAHAMYLAAGMPPNEWGDFDQLETHEADWNPNAQNPSSTAFGLGQFLDSTWASVGAQKTSDPKKQLGAMFGYIKQRYHGSPSEAWRMWQGRSPHWYDYGGPLFPGLNLAYNASGQNELVVNQDQQQRIAQAIATSAQPADPGRSGTQVPPEILQQLPHIANQMKPPSGPQQQPGQGPSAGPLPAEQAPGAPVAPEEPRGPQFGPPAPSTPQQPSPLPSGAPGAKASTIKPVAPGERPEQADIAPAPASTDHELPAVKQGVTSAASTLGNWAAMAASMGMMGAGGGGGGGAGSLISGLFSEGGKIVNAAINVGASALVGTLTPGTTDNPYGVAIKGQQAPNTLAPVNGGNDLSTHYHGDLYSTDMNQFFRQQQVRDAQNMQAQLGARGGWQS